MIPGSAGLNALVVEGGAMRSIFSVGLLDGFLNKRFNPFDFAIGVSAGSFNLVNYISANSGLGLSMYLEAAANKEFINYRRFLKGGNLLDLDWLYQKLVKTHFPDADTATPLYACVTSVDDGNPRYIRLTTENYATTILASCALPLLYRKFPLIDNSPMVDGGIADGIPVQQAIALGASRIMVVRSRPYRYKKTDSLWHKYIRWKLSAHPALVNTMRKRIDIFNNTIRLLRQPPAGIQIMEICPPASFTSGRFDRHNEHLRRGYEQGYQAANKTVGDWQQL